MPDSVKIIALGGLDEDGKNCVLVEINSDIYVIQCGVRFPDKSMPGIDYVIPDFTYLKERKDKVRAYFLLSGNDDQVGALSYLYDEVPAPVYGSDVTLGMLSIFLTHIGKSPKGMDLWEVEPSSTFKVNGRKIQYFQTASNIARSSGVAIETSYGNVVYSGTYVVENNSSKNYYHDFRHIAEVSESAPTLVLMCESSYAERSGYTAPSYKVTPLIEQTIRDAKGRTFVSMFAMNCYNIDELIALAVQNKKKIIPYDESTSKVLNKMQSLGQLPIPRDNFARLDELNQFKEEDIIILMLGHGSKLFNKIALLADGSSKEKFVTVKESDTFILASPSNHNTELVATEALDELYRTGCHVLNLTKKQFVKMHPSEEDLKTMISLFNPKYYIPVKGLYRSLLANAMVALNMGIGLSHNNVFLLENGLTWSYDGAKARLNDESIPHKGIMIDGIGVGDVSSLVLADRQKLSEGIVVCSVILNKRTHQVIAGPDIQIKGLGFSKDIDVINKELGAIFLDTLASCFAEGRKIDDIKNICYERLLRQIRRDSGKEPMVLPLIIEAEKE